MDTLDKFLTYFEQATGITGEFALDELVLEDDYKLVEHFVLLMRKANAGSPFGKIKLPDGNEIYISPGISAWKKEFGTK